MSIFTQVIGEREALEAEQARSTKAARDAHEHAKETFKVEFIKSWKTVAMPIFISFVNDAKANGYDAVMREAGNNTSKYGGDIRLMSTRGKLLPQGSSNEVFIFALGGEPYDQVVKLVAFCETADNWHTIWDKPKAGQTGDLNMVSKEVLEATFKLFLESTLDSVTTAEIPPTLSTVVVIKDPLSQAAISAIRGIGTSA